MSNKKTLQIKISMFSHKTTSKEALSFVTWTMWYSIEKYENTRNLTIAYLYQCLWNEICCRPLHIIGLANWTQTKTAFIGLAYHGIPEPSISFRNILFSVLPIPLFSRKYNGWSHKQVVCARGQAMGLDLHAHAQTHKSKRAWNRNTTIHVCIIMNCMIMTATH